MIQIVVACGTNRAIGRDNQLLWHLPNDLKHFKQLTSGAPIIMGRKTFESIGRPLPNRLNVVISRNPNLHFEGTTVVSSLEAALELCSESEKVSIVGGGEIYKQALSIADVIELTLVDDSPEADTFFPELSNSDWELVKSESHSTDEKHAVSFTFLTYQKR